MSNAIFTSPDHRAFYFTMLEKAGINDCYHRALFYTIGISVDSRSHVDDLFDFAEDCIRPEGLEKAWQTGGTLKLTRLAFNLWNSFTEVGHEHLSSPNELFWCSYAPYFYEAVKLRYPEYCRDISRTPPNYDVNPHMHLIFCPINDQGKLSAKSMLGNQKRLSQWQTDYHQVMHERWPLLERGESSLETHRKHLPTWLLTRLATLSWTARKVTSYFN